VKFHAHNFTNEENKTVSINIIFICRNDFLYGVDVNGCADTVHFTFRKVALVLKYLSRLDV